MDSVIVQHVAALNHWLYLALFVGLLFEGETVLFVAFYLVRQEHLSVTLAIIAALSGVLAGDFLWYQVGHFLNRFAWLKQKLDRVAGPIDRQLIKRPMRTLFISKFAYGLHRLTQIRSGALRIAWRVFWQADVPAAILWIAIVASLGYFTALSVAALRHYMHFTQFGLLFGILLLWGITHIISHINRHRLHMDKVDMAELEK